MKQVPQFEMSVWRSGELGSHMATLPPVPPAPAGAAAAAAAAAAADGAAAVPPKPVEVERDVISAAPSTFGASTAPPSGGFSWYAEVPDAVADSLTRRPQARTNVEMRLGTRRQKRM